MGIATELHKRTQALRTVLSDCNDALHLQEAPGADDLSGIAEQILGMQGLKILRGTFTLSENSNAPTIRIPGTPQIVSVLCSQEGGYTQEGIVGACYDNLSWRKTLGEDVNALSLYYSQKDDRTAMTYGAAIVEDGSVVFPPVSGMDWLAGVEYVWTAYYFVNDPDTAEASFDVTEGIKAYLIPLTTGGYRLALVGQGEARLYVEKEDGTLREIKYSDPRPWDAYNGQI